MNDQQSPSAPDPQDPTTPNSVFRSRPETGLSDQEAFSLLAESMTDGHNGDRYGNGTGRGSNGEQRVRGHQGDGAGFDHRRGREMSTALPPGWRAAGTEAERPGSMIEHRANGGEMPPVVPFRTDSATLNGAYSGERPAALSGRTAKRHGFDWSTPVLVDEHWELVGPHTDFIHGQITEVIDLTRVPPAVISTGPDGGVAVIDPGTDTIDPPMEAPVAPNARPARRDRTNRILPPVEENHDADPLPPLVFLNTRGDILPRIGATSTGRNGDTFGSGVVPRDGGEPPVAATSGRGVENMADPRTDIQAATDRRRRVDLSDEFVEPGLIHAGDTQVLHPHTNRGAAIRLTADSPVVPVDPGPFHAETASQASQGVEADPRLGELQRIFDQYSGPVIAVIASIAGDRRAIDEALQSTFEAVWKTVDTFDPEQPRGPWMFTLARRQATEQVELARRLAQEAKPGRYPVPSHRQDQAIAVDKSWEAWEVRLAVDQLTQAEHDVLRLIHNKGLIHPEVAAQLHTTVGAVKSRAYSGSHRLVELLDHVIRPDATEELTFDQAAALTWYLAGVADGSDLDAEERSAVRRVQAQLASATAWINPDSHARERVISYARRTLDDPGPPTGTVTDSHGPGFHRGDAIDGAANVVDDRGQKVTGGHEKLAEPATVTGRPWLIVGLSVVGLVALFAAFALRSGSTEAGSETVRRYEMQTAGLDADATGVVEITTVSTGSRYEMEFGGLDPTADDQFYAVWLQSTAGGGVVPLGTFSWRAAGDPLVLSGPTWSDAYDVLVITRSETMTRASIDDPMVLSVSIE